MAALAGWFSISPVRLSNEHVYIEGGRCLIGVTVQNRTARRVHAIVFVNFWDETLSRLSYGTSYGYPYNTYRHNSGRSPFISRVEKVDVCLNPREKRDVHESYEIDGQKRYRLDFAVNATRSPCPATDWEPSWPSRR